jgi:hypothetical protein
MHGIGIKSRLPKVPAEMPFKRRTAPETPHAGIGYDAGYQAIETHIGGYKS